MGNDNIATKLLQVVNISPLDNDAGYLNEKITGNSNLSVSVIDPDGNGNEKILMAALPELTSPIRNFDTGFSPRNFVWGENSLLDEPVSFSNIVIGDSSANFTIANNFNNIILGNSAAFAEVQYNDNVIIGNLAANDISAKIFNSVIIGSNALEFSGISGMGNCVLIGKSVAGNGAFDADNTIIIGSFSDFNNNLGQTDSIIIGFAIAPNILTKGWCVGGLGVKQHIFEGANAAMGIATLVAGTVTVNNNLVTANSRIFLTNNNPGGAVGALSISARVAGTSFTITSTSGTDTSDIAWEIKEPT